MLGASEAPQEGDEGGLLDALGIGALREADPPRRATRWPLRGCGRAIVQVGLAAADILREADALAAPCATRPRGVALGQGRSGSGPMSCSSRSVYGAMV